MPRDGAMPLKTKIEFGHKYQWNEELGFWYNTEVGFGENPVQIFPPVGARTDWWVVAPRVNTFTNLRGQDVEARCFAIADGLITQDQDPA